MLDSATKLRIILDMCRRLGVQTAPRQLGGLWVVPLMRWVRAEEVSALAP